MVATMHTARPCCAHTAPSAHLPRKALRLGAPPRRAPRAFGPRDRGTALRGAPSLHRMGATSSRATSGSFDSSDSVGHDYWDGGWSKEAEEDAHASRIQPLDDVNCGVHLTRGEWALATTPAEAAATNAGQVHLKGRMSFRNTTAKNEIFVTDVRASGRLLSEGKVKGLHVECELIPKHPDPEDEFQARKDGYWPGYVTVAGGRTGMLVEVRITAETHGVHALSPAERLERLMQLDALWLRFEYQTYGPHGLVPKTQSVVLPLREPESLSEPLPWKDAVQAPEDKAGSLTFSASPGTGALVCIRMQSPRTQRLTLPTHLLSTVDDPVEVIKKYAVPYAKPGDIVTIGETPLTAMQGRWRDPATVRPGWLAKLGCKVFKALIDLAGWWRVFFALIAGILAKVFLRKTGVFYMVAGYQARLMDDLTGCIPPYDKFIMPGPNNPQALVERVKAETGLECAVVDVNDKSKYLGLVILASTAERLNSVITAALIDNPTGNAIEQTPLVLIRQGVPGQVPEQRRRRHLDS